MTVFIIDWLWYHFKKAAICDVVNDPGHRHVGMSSRLTPPENCVVILWVLKKGLCLSRVTQSKGFNNGLGVLLKIVFIM